MALLVLAHVDAHDGSLVVEQVVGKRSSELRLADPRRPEEQERADRAVRIGQAGARAPDRVRDGFYRFDLVDDPLVEGRLEMHELLHLAFHEPRYRNPGPSRHDLSDVFLGDLLVQEPSVALHLGERGVLGLELTIQLHEGAVAELGRALQIGIALGALGFGPGLFDLRLELADLIDALLLLLPVRGHRAPVLS